MSKLVSLRVGGAGTDMSCCDPEFTSRAQPDLSALAWMFTRTCICERTHELHALRD